jgi:uncharacterized YccA/Bax inhibitor family protein
VYRTSNPLLRLRDTARGQSLPEGVRSASLRGVAGRLAVLAGVVVVASLMPLQRAVAQPLSAQVLLVLGLAVVMIYGTLMYVRRAAAPFAASVYALGIGLMVGSASAMLTRSTGGLFGVAMLGGVAALLVVIWMFGVVIREPRSNRFLVAHIMIGGMFMMTLVALLVQPYVFDVALRSGGPRAACAFAVGMVGVCGWLLAADMERLRGALEAPTPARFEWYCAAGVLTQLVWFPCELVRGVVFLVRPR